MLVKDAKESWIEIRAISSQKNKQFKNRMNYLKQKEGQLSTNMSGRLSARSTNSRKSVRAPTKHKVSRSVFMQKRIELEMKIDEEDEEEKS